MLLAFMACTNDYFVDETNFRLHVPQIQEGSIQNFYVAFHTADGRHVATRELTAPFDEDENMKEGILRFKLPPGKDYRISCFADYTPGSISVGRPYDESHKTKDLDESKDNLYVGDGNVYISRTTNPRSVFTTATVLPVGHPDSKIPHEVDIDPSRLFKGNIVLSFIELPETISRIDAYYSGLSTAYYFDGTFRGHTVADRIRGSYDVADYLDGGTVGIRDIINPSAGNVFGSDGMEQRVTDLSALSALELEIHLYDAAGNQIGVIPFTEEEFDNLPDEKKPVDENGIPITNLALLSQKTIKFTFKGFTLIQIELVGWGDIVEGKPTPM